jgi:hypothetical protein
MKNILKQYDGKRSRPAAVRPRRNGSVLVLTVIVIMILGTIGVGVLAIAYGVRQQAIMMKNETASMLAAEAGFEKSVFWMTQQPDMLTTLYHSGGSSTGSLYFPGSSCDYLIKLYSFINARPIYRVISNGHSGVFNRKVDVLVMQAIGGWDMGLCRIPNGATTTAQINFVNGEVIDMPVHINNYNDSPDNIDIYITGSPQFLGPVAMGESRYNGATDKYSSVINLFNRAGIYFNQPDSRITDEDSVQSKVDRFSDSTAADYKFEPNSLTTSFPGPNQPAVQLEFFVDPSGVGKVRITNNCLVRVFKQPSDSRTYDYWVLKGSNPRRYERYYIYAYHFRPIDGNQSIIRPVADTYVTQSYGDIQSDPGGQIFVDGNVIIGGDSNDANLAGTINRVKGQITVVATGTIWVANEILVDGPHDVNGPTLDNPNVLGLFAQRVVKVVDPGISGKSTGSPNYYPGRPGRDANVPADYNYAPIGLPDTGFGSQPSAPYSWYNRHLPNPMVVEAAITDGGGGWGAENVARGSYGGRKDTDPNTGHNDILTMRGSFTDVMRGIVGQTGSNGYIKDYHLDERLLQGILPGDIGLQGKYIATPAGWHDYRN